jgi:hypothetical protein
MKLIYSTSRPAPDVVSKELIASFDLIMTGQLASEADAKHLGVSFRTKSEPYSFLVTQHSDIYDERGEHREMIDISKLDVNFGGDNEPHDDYLSELLNKAYKGEIDCRKAIVPMELVKPFSSYKPDISEGYTTHFMEAFKANTPPDLLVYEKDGKFIMSDDYNAYHMYKTTGSNNAICTIIGETTITEGVEYGPSFKMQLPTLQKTESAENVTVSPEQCHLWTMDLSDTPIITNTFEEVKIYKEPFSTDADHRERSLLRCKDCGQLYFYEWLEWVDWDEGNDPTYSKYIPVISEEAAQNITKLSSIELMKLVPRLERNYPSDADHPTMLWVK